MATLLRALIVEDSEDDAMLIVRELERGGFHVDFKRVDMPEIMNDAIRSRRWDVILSDHSMPHFSAPAALDVLKRTELDLPFIIVSGKIGEETAVDMLKAGAHDFIDKNNLSRLVPAVEREIRAARVRQRRRTAEEEIKKSEKRFRQLAEDAPDLVFRLRLLPKLGIEYINPASKVITGYAPDEHYMDPTLFLRMIHPDDAALLERIGKTEGATGDSIEVRLTHRDGMTLRGELRFNSILDEFGNVAAVEGILRDVTARKSTEEMAVQDDITDERGGSVLMGNILLVEDNPDDIDLTLRALKKHRVANEVIVARDGAEALGHLFTRVAHSDRNSVVLPSLILLDLKLPKVDGLEVLRQIRANDLTRTVPVAILTSSREEQDRIRSSRLGANCFIRKPVDFDRLTTAVQQLQLYWMVLNRFPIQPGGE